MTELPAPQDVARDFVWNYIRDKGRRPTVGEVDRVLYRDHAVSADPASALPVDLFTITPVLPDGRTNDDASVGLTLNGVPDSPEGKRVLDLVFTAIRQAADREREFEPAFPGETARFTASDFCDFNQLGRSGADRLLPLVGELLRSEHWGGTWIEGSEGFWAFEVSRDVRQFNGVSDLETYLRRRSHSRRTFHPKMNLFFWAATASAFAVAGVFIATPQQWPLDQTISLTATAPAMVLSLHFRNLDRHLYTCIAFAFISATWFIVRFYI